MPDGDVPDPVWKPLRAELTATVAELPAARPVTNINPFVETFALPALGVTVHSHKAEWFVI